MQRSSSNSKQHVFTTPSGDKVAWARNTERQKLSGRGASGKGAGIEKTNIEVVAVVLRPIFNIKQPKHKQPCVTNVISD
jgi:hypothetical protein